MQTINDAFSVLVRKQSVLVVRQLHVLDETFVMNACKEDCCYVAKDWADDVRIAKKKGTDNTIIRDYVLPGELPGS
jgi:actin-related protein 6